MKKHFQSQRTSPVKSLPLVRVFPYFADACLVCMSEQVKDCRIITIDHADFSVYRRFGRQNIPLLVPDE